MKNYHSVRTSAPHLLRGLVASLLGLIGLYAAEQPLGVVEQAGETLTVRFDAAARLEAGAMLAVYGPGTVEKHPLTKEVIIERRQLIAKAQVNGIDGAVIQARVVWKTAVAPSAGCDVVPLPNEAAPNAAPSLTAKPQALSALVGATVAVRLPIVDPDGDDLGFTWAVKGPAGQSGVLAARTGSRPEILWTAPGLPGASAITVTARDPWGQELTAEIAVQANAETDWRSRELKSALHFGGELQPALTCMARDGAGAWWAISDGGRILRYADGWRSAALAAFPADKAPRSPVALAHVRDELFVLDSRGVTVYGPDFNPRRSFGQVQKPTDLVIARDGTAFIADQGAGGILVYENDGRFRARLGQAGVGDEAFTELTRLSLGPDGTLYALDARQRRVQRFDRHHRRLPTWTVQTDERNPPVDCAIHPKGLLVALASGVIQVFDRKGSAGEAWKPLSETQLVPRADLAAALYVDHSGEVLLSFPGRGLVARYSADGRLNGVRGAALWELRHLAADGRGRLFGLDDNAHVLEFDHEGWLVARFGGPLGSGGFFDDPTGLAVSPDGSVLAVMGAGRQMVVRFALDSDRTKPLVFGQPGRNPGQFQKPVAIACDALGRTYVLDAKQYRVQVFDAQGAFLFTFGRSGRGADELSDPLTVAVTPDGTAAFIYDDDTYELKKFAIDFTKNEATHVNNTGGKGDAPGQFRAVTQVACDRRGLLYTWDSSRKDLQILDFRGTNAVAGTPRKLAELGVERVDRMALSPDGLVHLAGSGMVTGWGW